MLFFFYKKKLIVEYEVNQFFVLDGSLLLVDSCFLWYD